METMHATLLPHCQGTSRNQGGDSTVADKTIVLKALSASPGYPAFKHQPHRTKSLVDFTATRRCSTFQHPVIWLCLLGVGQRVTGWKKPTNCKPLFRHSFRKLNISGLPYMGSHLRDCLRPGCFDPTRAPSKRTAPLVGSAA